MQYLVFLSEPLQLSNGSKVSVIATRVFEWADHFAFRIATFDKVKAFVPSTKISGWFTTVDNDPGFEEYIENYREECGDEFVDLRSLEYSVLDENPADGGAPILQKKTATSIFEKL